MCRLQECHWFDMYMYMYVDYRKPNGLACVLIEVINHHHKDHKLTKGHNSVRLLDKIMSLNDIEP